MNILFIGRLHPKPVIVIHPAVTAGRTLPVTADAMDESSHCPSKLGKPLAGTSADAARRPNSFPSAVFNAALLLGETLRPARPDVNTNERLFAFLRAKMTLVMIQISQISQTHACFVGISDHSAPSG
ncbi:hypothetical protein KL86PLE_40765 [uncultured Pleomorphomonas sp.]|uniref:Uncharacterized protein n=1 Tax=uncultured Pleomorphomonas sp. TaxID=442121 RepID=A0A212LHI4_9HYPH|nr:hypothetical protein KL86PLE_40765 [uncultured Pleomorphomonas sp.]